MFSMFLLMRYRVDSPCVMRRDTTLDLKRPLLNFDLAFARSDGEGVSFPDLMG